MLPVVPKVKLTGLACFSHCHGKASFDTVVFI